MRPVVQLHGHLLAGVHRVNLDRLQLRHEGDVLQRLLVYLAVRVALGRAFVIVEGDARADDVQHGGAPVAERRLEQLAYLLGIAREGARDEGRVSGQRLDADVDRRQLIHTRILKFLADVRCGGKLALGQAIDAVILDDVNHRYVAADHVLELAQADAARVAVAAYADGDEIAVGRGGAGGDGRHTPMQGVEAVRTAQEVGRGFAGAADSAQFDDLVRVDRQLIAYGDDLVGDRVVAAALAQRRRPALVVVTFQTDQINACCAHVS